MLPTGLIRDTTPANGRATLNLDHIISLAQAIGETGLLHPITVRSAGGATYELIAGRHRLEAVRRLGHPSIAAQVVDADDAQAATIRLVENVARSNLSPVEEAQQLAAVVETDPEGTIGVARRLGRSQSWVEGRLEIMQYDQALIEAIHTHAISLAAASRLARIQDDNLRAEYIHQASTHGINTRTAAAWLAQSQTNASPQNVLSENTVQEGNTKITTTTTAECFNCHHPTPIEQTVPLRLCVNCHDAIRNVQHEETTAPRSTDPT